MVAHPIDYKWSSYRFHAQESLGLQSELWQSHELYLKPGHQQSARAKLIKHYSNTIFPTKSLGGFDPLGIGQRTF